MTATESGVALSPKQQVHAEGMHLLVRDAVIDLAQQLARGHTEGFLEVLAFYQKFWRYSARNLLLIRCQKPDATQVAGYSTWQRLDRQVRKGAQAIWIWAPIVKKEREDGEEREICLGFRPAAVFDASDLADIETNPLPSIWRPLPDDCEDEYWRAVAAIGRRGIRVTEASLPRGVQGTATADAITVSNRIGDSRNRLATLLHEYAHCLAHFGLLVAGKTNQQCELEAEAACFVAMKILGLDYPFARDYLLNFKATPDALHQSLGAIQMIVRRMLESLDVAGRRGDKAA